MRIRLSLEDLELRRRRARTDTRYSFAEIRNSELEIGYSMNTVSRVPALVLELLADVALSSS